MPEPGKAHPCDVDDLDLIALLSSTRPSRAAWFHFRSLDDHGSMAEKFDPRRSVKQVLIVR